MQFPAWKPSLLSIACQSSPITSVFLYEYWGSHGPLRLWPTQETLTTSPAYRRRLSASASILELVKQGENQQDGLIIQSQNHISILMLALNSIILSGSSSISPSLLSVQQRRGHLSVASYFKNTSVADTMTGSKTWNLLCSNSFKCFRKDPPRSHVEGVFRPISEDHLCSDRTCTVLHERYADVASN